ncbi:MAG TPA: TauD/TfdA family dioxygenase [Acidimicrobiales bacterium]|nr:TauD/TfdA family dioxygenase [Acidimicrobiales bacterium]
MTVITTEKLTPTVGALVAGVDHDQLLRDDTLPGWILEALDAHGVLVFRGLHLDDATQVAFSRRLGTVEKFGDGEHPEIFLVTLDPARNRAAAYLRGTFHWHIDGCTDDVPIMATMLCAHAVADRGGETEFANTYQAYEDLSEEEQGRLATVRVVHTIGASMRLHTPDPTPEQEALWRQRPAKEHPLVWTHRSGRKSLVLGATADHVVGLDVEEGRALLDDLLARATVPSRVYRHEWQVGDVVIWDNRGVLHRAAPYDPSSPRDMHRTTFAGDEPIA